MKMKTKIIAIAIFCILFSSFSVAAEMKSEAKILQIYLPRQVTIEGEIVRLGRVAVMRGEDSLVESACEIALGKFSVPGQEIVIDKAAVMSLLAGSGINTKNVKLTGAEKLVVKQNLKIITGKEIVDAAIIYLKETEKYSSAADYTAVRIPKNIVIPPDSNDIKITPQLAGNSTVGCANVQLKIDVDGKEADTVNLPFKIRYKINKAVSIGEIAKGQVITTEKIKIITELSDTPQPTDWKAPYGLVAETRIPANKIIEDGMTAEKASEVVIKRNQSILIKVDRPGLLLTAAGMALENGSEGQYIKVRNVDSNRIILARIVEDGTVEPVF